MASQSAINGKGDVSIQRGEGRNLLLIRYRFISILLSNLTFAATTN